LPSGSAAGVVESGDGAPTLTSLAHDLRDAGVSALVLRCSEALGGAPGFREGTIEILVPRDQRAAALQRFEAMDWHYHLGTEGAWRLLPAANFWWPGPVNLFVYWGLPALPFPARALGRLERRLWAGAHPHPEGHLEPDAAALLVYLAFQASRPGVLYHRDDFEHFVACRSHVKDWRQVWRIAAAAALAPAVRSALDAANAGGSRPQPGPVFGGRMGPAWRVATAVQRRARPQWVSALLAGRLHLGDAPVRCRMAGVEVETGPRVFVPTPDARRFVDLALARIGNAERPTVVEVGTGSGGIALALARAHPGAAVHAADTSRDAVRWARRNARRQGLHRVRFYRGSLLQPFPSDELEGKVSIVLANLPFYPSRSFAPIGAVAMDAIEGQGDDGLELLRELARDARALLEPGGALVLQMFGWQWDRMVPELTALGYRPGVPLRTGPFAICPAELS
jgi:methylase of polypeptide subunit release factors